MQPVNDIGETFALFVGSLSASTTQEHLVQYFSRFGTIQGANLITDWATGVSKRCAIVFCADEQTSVRALSFKTHRLDGKLIRVSLADQDKKGTKKISTTNLFVGNIAEKCTEEEIHKLFDKFGPIESVRFFRNASTKPNTKNAIIQYADSKSVELAFKSKSEMGCTDDSLKISPLKQKKNPNAKPDQFEDFAKMMMMQFCQPPPIETPSNFDTFAGYREAGLPIPPARKHRKSSSADLSMLSMASSFQPSEYNTSSSGLGFYGSAYPMQPIAESHPVNMTKQMKLPNEPVVSKGAIGVNSKPQTQSSTKSINNISEGSVDWDHASENNKYNFITLIDLFDDDDGISATFFGTSPSQSKLGQNTNSSVLSLSLRQLKEEAIVSCLEAEKGTANTALEA
jgi:RNA recognition motif-containing protein